MSDENKVGGLEVKVDILLDQTSKIFTSVNQTNIDFAAHVARSNGQFERVEVRHDDLKEDVGSLRGSVEGIETRVDVVEKTQSNAKWYFLGMGGGGLLGGATLLEIIRGIIKGGG